MDVPQDDGLIDLSGRDIVFVVEVEVQVAFVVSKIKIGLAAILFLISTGIIGDEVQDISLLGRNTLHALKQLLLVL